METYIAILRGINVGGKKAIQMADLKAKLAALNYKNIRTYIQSGNIVFEYPKSIPSDLQAQIEAEIQNNYGFQVPVIVLKVSELNEILSGNPFINNRKEDEKLLHITYLSQKPTQENLGKILQLANPQQADELMVGEKCIYLFCPNGYGRTKLTNTFLEQKLQVTATTRNWKTSKKLIEIAERLS